MAKYVDGLAAHALCVEALHMVGRNFSGLHALLLAAQAYYRAIAAGRGIDEDDLTTRALERARATRNLEALHLALFARGCILMGAPTCAERIETASELIALGDQTGDAVMVAHGLRIRGSTYWEIGDRPRFEADLDRLETISSRLGVTHRFFAALWRAHLALIGGDLDGAAALSQPVAELAGANLTLARAQRVFMFFLVRARGEGAVLCDMMEQLLAGGEDDVGLRVALALVHSDAGQTDVARRHYEAVAAGGFAGIPHNFSRQLLLAEAAEACVLTGGGGADVLYQELVPFASTLVSVGSALASAGAVDRYLGMLASTLGRVDRAVAHFESAARLETSVSAPFFVDQTRAWRARMLEKASRERVRLRA